MIMGESLGSLILAIQHSRTSTHNSIAMKQNANSSIHANEHGKVVWSVNDHAADSSTFNRAFDRRLIQKQNFDPRAEKLLIRSLHPFTFKFIAAQCPCLAVSRSVSPCVRRTTDSCCRQLVVERQPAKGS